MSAKSPHVLIIGAGIGGLTLAQCLRKQGVSFEVFERDASPDARGQGWAIGLHNLDALFSDSLPSDLPPLHSTQHLKPLDLPSQVVYYFPNGKMLHVTDSPETPCIRANRLRLRTLLSTGVDIKFGKEASRIEESDTEGVTVFFTDGTSARGDVLVGADGTHSAVRPHVLKKPNEEVLVQFPATIIAGEVKLSGKEMEEQLRLGHSAIMNIQADGILFSGVNKVTVSEETGETTGDYYWVLSVMDPTVDQPGHWTKTSSQEEKLRFAKEKVSVLDEKRRVTVDSTEVGGLKAYSSWWETEISELPPVNRVVLIGDAAHAMTPNRGEGGIQAIAGAVQLSKVLAGAESGDISGLRQQLDDCQKEIFKAGHDSIMKTRAAMIEVRAGRETPKAWGHFARELKELAPLPFKLTTSQA